MPGILVVEPDDELALALEEALEDAQFNVESVASINQAKLTLRGCHFDLVVLARTEEPVLSAEFLACLRGNASTARSPALVASPAELQELSPVTAGSRVERSALVQSQRLASFVDAVREALRERTSRGSWE
jgi:DNA-binding response OmpR family regulator